MYFDSIICAKIVLNVGSCCLFRIKITSKIIYKKREQNYSRTKIDKKSQTYSIWVLGKEFKTLWLDRQGGIQGGKYLERRKVKKPDRHQQPDGPAEYYTSQVFFAEYYTSQVVIAEYYSSQVVKAEYYTSQVVITEYYTSQVVIAEYHTYQVVIAEYCTSQVVIAEYYTSQVVIAEYYTYQVVTVYQSTTPLR